MRIFSKFRDYYDIGLQYGIDPNCKYLRETKSLEQDNKDAQNISEKLLKHSGNLPGDYYKVGAYHLILFCGQLFFCIEFIRFNNGEYDPVFVYSYDHLKKYVKSLKDKRMTIELFGKKRKHRSRYNFGYGSDITIEEILKLFPKKRNEALIQLLVDHKVPIIQYTIKEEWSKELLILNPSLRKVEFFKVIDPVTAFQELSMFISGIMGGSAPPMIEIPDEIRLEEHGFDKITSFRKM